MYTAYPITQIPRGMLLSLYISVLSNPLVGKNLSSLFNGNGRSLLYSEKKTLTKDKPVINCSAHWRVYICQVLSALSMGYQHIPFLPFLSCASFRVLSLFCVLFSYKTKLINIFFLYLYMTSGYEIEAYVQLYNNKSIMQICMMLQNKL